MQNINEPEDFTPNIFQSSRTKIIIIAVIFVIILIVLLNNSETKRYNDEIENTASEEVEEVDEVDEVEETESTDNYEYSSDDINEDE